MMGTNTYIACELMEKKTSIMHWNELWMYWKEQSERGYSSGNLVMHRAHFNKQ